MWAVENTEYLRFFIKTLPLGVGLGNVPYKNIPTTFIGFQFQGNMGAPRSVVHYVDENAKTVMGQEVLDLINIVVLLMGRGVHILDRSAFC